MYIVCTPIHIGGKTIELAIIILLEASLDLDKTN